MHICYRAVTRLETPAYLKTSKPGSARGGFPRFTLAPSCYPPHLVSFAVIAGELPDGGGWGEGPFATFALVCVSCARPPYIAPKRGHRAQKQNGPSVKRGDQRERDL